MATGGAEKFSFHSPHHRVLKFAKQGGQFSLCFLLRTKIKTAKRRGRNYYYNPNRAKWPGTEPGNKKSSKSFSDLLLSLAAGGRLVFSFESSVQAGPINQDLYVFYKNQFNGFSNSTKKCRKVSRNLSLAYVFPFLRLKRARTNEISIIIGIYSTNTKIIIQNTSINFSPY